MMKFQYKAKNPGGKVISGEIDAVSATDAKKRLMRSRLKPISIKAMKSGNPGENVGLLGGMIYWDDKGALQLQLGSGNPTTKELIIFTKQFATLLNSGVPMIQGLQILAEQQKSRSFRMAIEGIRYSLENGQNLSDGLKNHPKIFDNLYCSMVEAGEASGQLDVILGSLVTYIEKAQKIKSQVKSAMMYPSFVVGAACIVITFMLVFIVPKFSEMFASSGQELPALTKIVMQMSDWLKGNFVTIIGIVFTTIATIIGWRSTESGKVQFDSLLLKAPISGPLIKKIAIGRFCQTLSTMLQSGVGILTALQICANSAGNRVIQNVVLNVKDRITQGDRFAEPLKESKIFPTMVISMIEVGEKTGSLDDMLKKVSEFYEEEVDLAVKGMISLIEPAMIVGLGGAVGFIVIAMFLPIFDLGNAVG